MFLKSSLGKASSSAIKAAAAPSCKCCIFTQNVKLSCLGKEG